MNFPVLVATTMQSPAETTTVTAMAIFTAKIPEMTNMTMIVKSND